MRAFWRREPSPAPASTDAALRGSPDPRERRGVRWNGVLVWFMRFVALLWIAKGLSFWATILGAGNPVPVFEDRSLGFQASVTYFAIIDIVAAVGLWLATAWGGVLWLLAVMSHLILAVFFPGIVPVDVMLAGLYVALMLVYLTISWLAASSEA